MITYRYAERNDGVVVDVDDVEPTEDGEARYFCIGCHAELVAKIHGTKVSKHFAHKPNSTCSNETYLHRLGIKVFKETFERCKNEGIPFLIQLPHPRVCDKFKNVFGVPCIFQQNDYAEHDIASCYDRVLIEPRVGEFVPDLLLQRDAFPDKDIFVEIAVTHIMTEKKEFSNARIIEIPLRTEADINVIRSCRLTEKTAKFVAINTKSKSMSDSDCRCRNYTLLVFVVYDSGECELCYDTPGGIQQRLCNPKERLAYFHIVNKWEEPKPIRITKNGISFREAIVRACENGFPLRNCFVCRHRNPQRTGTYDRPIWCQHLNEAVDSNEAPYCKAFRATPEVEACMKVVP